ncbi:MAG: helix-hairpin-helix domain-containing protein [Planctomycetes bacterium]|nr:helix-hairpin-helix domain-containing protein [Planctomycetota bacterium]
MHEITAQDCSRIAQDLQIRKLQVESVVQLLDEGNTVPFITRYRKERTGGVNEEVIRQIQGRVNFLRTLAERKQTILKSIEGQGKLTDELRHAIHKADTTKRLEDLYLPYKPKKKSAAGKAREQGLEPAALAIWHSDPLANNLEELLPALINPDKELPTVEEVRAGIKNILAEMMSETAIIRAGVRSVLWETGKVCSGKSDKLPEGQGLEYKDYFEFSESARQIPPHRILALNRGEKEQALRIRLEWHADAVKETALGAMAEHLFKVAGQMPAVAPPAPAPTADHPATEAPAASVAASPGQGEAPPVAEPTSAAEPAPAPVAESVTPTSEAATPPAEAVSPPAATPPAPAISAPAPSVSPEHPAAPPVLTGEPLVPGMDFKSPNVELLRGVLEDSLTRLLIPSLEREIRRELTDEAESHAVQVFARNLRSLLLQPPLRNRRVLAIDPGFRTGCKIAALDEYGNLLEHSVVFPHAPLPKKPREKPADKIAPPTAAVAPAPEAPPTIPETTNTASPATTPETTPPTESPAAPSSQTPEPAAQGESVQGESVQGESVQGGSIPVTPPVETAHSIEPTAVAVQADSAVQATETPAPAAAETAPTVDRKAEAKAKLHDLVGKHAVQVVALGNGTGCRETEEIIAELIGTLAPDLAYVIVNEAGASVYSTSPVGREEFPDHDATLRSTISIGRRLQDPLSELVKVDPHNVGVGLYQHDMSRKELKESLQAVVESCVNQVGVDLNTASVPLLRHVSGLNQLVARELVDFRNRQGPFHSREALLQVSGLGPARYVQAAGFLKIPGGPNSLDRTWIHPESYPVAERILAELGYAPGVLDDHGAQEDLRAKLKSVNATEVAGRLNVGVPTVEDILQALARPGRDPREDLPPPIFKKGILKLEDLQPGMELKGTVLNVVDFGAFVDIGLKDSGLVHISQMANRYIKSPYDVVAVNDVVTVWVLTVDKERHRVSLSMIKPGTERKPPERRPPAPRPEQREGRPPQRGRRPGGPPQGEAPGARQVQRGRPPHGRAPGPGDRRGQAGSPPGTTTGEPAHVAGGGVTSSAPPRPALPPRRRRREPPKPKLTQAALEGKVPLRTFGELSALFAAKKEPESKPSEESQAASAVEATSPLAPPAAPSAGEGGVPPAM